MNFSSARTRESSFAAGGVSSCADDGDDVLQICSATFADTICGCAGRGGVSDDNHEGGQVSLDGTSAIALSFLYLFFFFFFFFQR
jgi:hypothetical protein